ncbi:MAG: DUF1840 domain-containing protein [Nitrosomonas sp.]|uniref:DUF1840 domain-containing protein n=1 Tax=Nitrosomonas sp. TaxID=42353 RepID=UPI0025DD5A59|nr:DUF1840 domain-containing protein [Nitrosomonas sp.]MBY0473572.1 DUF1840 domain-containing protein [Nitrosomonas sp.]
MLVTFSTDAHADITMFNDIALIMLDMMGHSKTVPGAILATDIPMALDRLKTAINAEKASSPAQDENEDEDNKNEPAVSLANRALPLINLLTAAAEAECNVMWK